MWSLPRTSECCSLYSSSSRYFEGQGKGKGNGALPEKLIKLIESLLRASEIWIAVVSLFSFVS